MNCVECEMLKTRKNLIYEDEIAAAFLNDKPAVPGHIIVIQKQHFPIIENIPDDTMSNLFLAANKISTVCFEVFKAHGTNLLINNGIAAGQKTTHARIQVLPRFENDGINMQWEPLKLTEEEMVATELSLKSEIEREAAEEHRKKSEKEIEARKHEMWKPEEDIPENENYMLMQLERMP